MKKEPTNPSNQVPYLPISGWRAFPSKALPKHFNYGNIYHYLVESVTSFDAKSSDTDGDSDHAGSSDVHTSKPFTKGRNLFRSGHVKNMEDNQQKDHYFLKAAVLASYSQKSYSVTITISENSGTIKEGTCTCSAAGLGRCAHVAALLFALEDFISEFGYDLPTCTEKLCSWNKGRRKNKLPSTVHSKSYPSMKKELKKKRASGTDIITTDPRPSNQRYTEISKEEKNSFVSDLSHIGGESGWETLLEYEYDDFSIDEYGVEVLQQQCQQFHENLQNECEEKTQPFMANNTIDQSESDVWMFHRQCRITASNCKDVACVQKGQTGLVKRLLWDRGPLTPAILYGQENEPKALEQFTKENPNLIIEKTGLWLNPTYPQLGCSPDGLTKDTQSGEEGLLEIKCPFVLKHCNPSNMKKDEVTLTKKQINNFFCSIENDKLRLKRNHKYYFQVQMQLGICEKRFCDFIVWSPSGMSVERID
jgi:hypothetical protein